LEYVSVEEESIGDRTPGITSHEGHQKGKTYKHHHVDVLVGWITLAEEVVVDVDEGVLSEDP